MTKSASNESGLGRRTFIGASASAAAIGAVGGSLPRRGHANTSKRGGKLTAGIGHGSTTDTLDPGLIDNDFTVAVSNTLHNNLLEVDAAGNLKAELAESWEGSSDAKTWVFKLRKDVEFHDGKPLTAEDVVASLQHHMGPDTKSVAAPVMEQVESVKADGPQEVVIELKAGNADLPYFVTDPKIPVLPAKDGKADITSGNGCGPYRFENFEPGVRLKASRNDAYWKSDRAHFNEVELLSIVDGTARVNALATGTVDVIDRIDLKVVENLKRVDTVRVHSTVGTQHYTFPMMTTFEPFQNADVRMALKLSIDREEMVKKVLRGYGTAGNDHPIGQSQRYYADSLPQRTYDPDKAKWHVKQSGLGPIKVELSASEAAFGGAIDAAVLYQQSAAKAGIEIKVIREPNDGYWGTVWAKKQWSACYWPGSPTIDGIVSQAYLPTAPWNDTAWKDPRITELVMQGRVELDPVKRAEIYHSLQELISNEGATVVPMFANYVFATSAKIGHDDFGSDKTMDGMRFVERWWFKS